MGVFSILFSLYSHGDVYCTRSHPTSLPYQWSEIDFFLIIFFFSFGKIKSDEASFQTW